MGSSAGTSRTAANVHEGRVEFLSEKNRGENQGFFSFYSGTYWSSLLPPTARGGGRGGALRSVTPEDARYCFRNCADTLSP